MQYEEDQMHHTLAKMLAYLVIPAFCLLAVIVGLLLYVLVS